MLVLDVCFHLLVLFLCVLCIFFIIYFNSIPFFRIGRGGGNSNLTSKVVLTIYKEIYF